VNSGMVLDVTGFSGDNGAPIQQWEWLGGANQQWLISPQDSSYNAFTNLNSGKVLDVTGLSLDNGALLQQWDWLDGLNQQWQIIPVQDTYQVTGYTDIYYDPNYGEAWVTASTDQDYSTEYYYGSQLDVAAFRNGTEVWSQVVPGCGAFCDYWYDAFNYDFVEGNPEGTEIPTWSAIVWSTLVVEPIASVVSSIPLGQGGNGMRIPGGNPSVFDLKFRAFIPPAWVYGPDAVQNAALGKMANDILPKLCSGKTELVAPEIPGLAREMEDSNLQVRIEASAFLFTTARFRSDSATVLAAAIPVFVDHAQHDTVPETRRNCVGALAELKPEIPVEALPLMLNFAEGNDTAAAVQPGAIWGLARMANSHPEAAQALCKILTQNDPVAKKKSAIEAISANGVTDAQLLAALGGFLSDTSAGLQRAALLAINRYGSYAVTINREQLAKFIKTSTDKDLAALAQRLLDRAEQK
jgi:hypothetical protein